MPIKIDSARARKIVGTLSLSLGVFALANLETFWQEYHQTQLQESRSFITSHSKNIVVKTESGEVRAYKPLQLALGSSLEGDELKDGNPFAHLSSLEPLHEIMQKGVVHYNRETYRSPDYQEESGYDLLSYQVEHTDGSKSSILAYLERKDGGNAGHAVGAPDERIPFVVFMVSNGDKGKRYYFFRGTTLIEQSQLTTDEAQSLVSQRLSQGIPFLSVSR